MAVRDDMPMVVVDVEFQVVQRIGTRPIVAALRPEH